MKIFVTGSAGFIGYHLCRRLLADGHQVHGYDGLTPYYDVALKQQRQALLTAMPDFSSTEAMLEDKPALDAAIGTFAPDMVVHLAAQAGVRYGIDHPQTYASANLVGTFNLLEAVRTITPRHLLIASTSSVYGGNATMPFRETDRTDFPVSLYAATKKACEVMSHSYAHLFAIPTTCFRFFTVYGPWGRPDMALFKFVSAIENNEPIEVYGEGRMQRDFTYIDDLVEAIIRLMDAIPQPGAPITAEGVSDSLSPVAPWRSVNIAGGQPVGLMDFIETVERALGTKARKIMLPMQPGDVTGTAADASLLKALTQFTPSVELPQGVLAFVQWYRQWRSDTARARGL